MSKFFDRFLKKKLIAFLIGTLVTVMHEKLGIDPAVAEQFLWALLGYLGFQGAVDTALALKGKKQDA